MFDRAILHLDLDAFFVSVECLRNSKLQGLPLIVGGSSRRGVVASCSYEARRFGVHSAMPVKMAKQLCPDAIILKGDMDSYSKYSKLITEVIAEEAPLFEKSSIDEFYVDLTGMDRYFGCLQWSNELRTKIVRESGLPISFGLSVNKLISKISTGEAKPNGTRMIETGKEKTFIAPLSTAKIPSIGKVTYKKLSFMGVRTIKILSEIPPKLLEREFGKSGISLWKKANAIDNSPVIPFSERKSISSERTFQIDTIDIQKLKDQLTKMVTQLAFDLRQSKKLTSCVTVKIRYSDFNTYTRQKRIPYSAHDKTLLHYAHELFEKLYQRRQLVRLIGLKFSNLVHGHYQINLFEDTVEETQLLQQLDHIRRRFGKKAVTRAACMGKMKGKKENGENKGY
ncbi:MAG: DNA polymerase IV [Bacteroidetes bacterium]|nr:DNA polymerase IV [Bacteroidota bacterium]